MFVVTCVLDVLQLWHPMFLENVRATFLGNAILGTTFVLWDFPTKLCADYHIIKEPYWNFYGIAEQL